ncbi:metal ABC transporter substrate-binding protein [Methyloterricola oryzae]|uniref:metal ABC transporter substrate-binding protein n=1 Tax=Methyloterricola oryzae TaxID=1495050 RepID=UPI0005EBBF37|nr:metal ABC transporter substrate-binding protein [Methyloterricola oryzae]
MFKHPTFKHCLWLICLALTTAAHADLDTSSRLRIIASNYPLAYFAERIAGTRATVSMPVPAGEDPAFWKPSPRDIGDMQRADLILLNGADYEKWLARVSLPRLKTVDTSAAFKQDFIVIANAVTHSHGPAGTHSHAGTAFTTWLDLTQAVKQAEAIAQAFARKRPELKSQIMGNFASLRTDLEKLDSELKSLASAKPGIALLGSHPVYQYLARRYGLNLESVHWEPDEMPPAGEWQALESLNRERQAQWMLWEAQPNADIAKRLKETGVQSVVFDPCANRPEDGDFLSVMQQNKANLQRALGVR